MSNYNPNKLGYLSAKIKTLEIKVNQIIGENDFHLQKINDHLQQVERNNKLLSSFGYNLMSLGEISKNIEENLIIPGNDHKTINKTA